MTGNKKDGFTIIELALVVAIIAFIFGTIMFATQARIDASRIFTTKSRMQLISDAIETYARIYGHIPCPADPAITPTDPNFGWGSGTNTGTCENAVDIGTLSGGSRIMMGMVPVRTMFPELDNQVAVDGWGNRFNYIVTERYTETEYFSGSEPSFSRPATDEGAGYIICRDNDGSCALTTNNLAQNNGTTKRGDVAYILISSGPTGHASYKDRKPTLIQNNSLGLSADDEENGDFSDDGNMYIQTMPQSGYQDLLIFRNRWQIKAYINEDS